MADEAPPPGTCRTYPAVPGTPARPSTTRNVPDIGWNAGANSVKELDGNLRLSFTQPQVQGAVVGLTNTRDNPASYERITHGFLFGTDAVGRAVFRVVEAGRALTQFAPYTLGDVFHIRRVDGYVAYHRNSDVVLLSGVPSAGTVMAACSLYASGDAVESEESP